MQEKGIEWIFIGGVDNVLVKMVDPVFNWTYEFLKILYLVEKVL